MSGSMAAAARPGVAVRVAAARILDAVLVDGRSLKAELAPRQQKLRDPRDRALLEAICMEVLRRWLRYRQYLDELLKRPLAARARPAEALLWTALAQLDGLGLPPHAVISATVEAMRAIGQAPLAGLTNAVLRRFERERDVMINAAVSAESGHREHPDWLREQLREDWGDVAEVILDAGNQLAPMWLRVAQPVAGSARDAQLERWSIDGPAVDRDGIESWPASGIRLAQSLPVRELPGFVEGTVSVQDGAAQFAAGLLDPQTGDRVLDACAAPGGKSAHLLEYRPDMGVLLALDRDPQRLRRVGETLERTGGRAELRAADAGDPASWWDGRPFQRILLDAPCSGTGVIRRQPDIKWHRRADDMPVLCAAQQRLLDALWPLLAPGGRLVYATCSVLRDENSRQIDAFLQRHPEARTESLALPVGRADGAGWQLFPGEAGMDGFFYASLRRDAAAGDAGQ